MKEVKTPKKHFEFITEWKIWEQVETFAKKEDRSYQYVLNQLVKLGIKQKTKTDER